MAESVLLQVLVAVAASWATFCVGLVRGWSSPALPQMTAANSTLVLAKDEVAWVASLPALCALIGSLLVSVPMQYLGRRRTLIGIAVPFILGFSLMGMSHYVSNKIPLYLGRILTGFVVGGSIPAAQIYVSECASARIRGLLGSFTSAFLSLGILVVYVIGSLVSWPVLCFVLAIFPTLLASAMFFTPESPAWLLSKGRHRQAKAALKRLRGSEAEHEYERMWSDVQRFKDQESGAAAGAGQHWRALRSRWVLQPLLISSALMLFQQFSGINAVIFYTVSIFAEAASSVERNTATIIVGAVQLVSTMVATTMVDRFGRRPLLLASGVGSCVSLASMGLFFYLKVEWGAEEASAACGWLPLASLIVFVVAYSIGLGPVPFLVMGEIFPAEYRNALGSVSSSFNLTCTFVVVRTFPDLSLALGQHGVFWFYAASCALSVLFVGLAVPETKGKTLEEIGRLFRPPGLRR